MYRDTNFNLETNIGPWFSHFSINLLAASPIHSWPGLKTRKTLRNIALYEQINCYLVNTFFFSNSSVKLCKTYRTALTHATWQDFIVQQTRILRDMTQDGQTLGGRTDAFASVWTWILNVKNSTLVRKRARADCWFVLRKSKVTWHCAQIYHLYILDVWSIKSRVLELLYLTYVYIILTLAYSDRCTKYTQAFCKTQNVFNNECMCWYVVHGVLFTVYLHGQTSIHTADLIFCVLLHVSSDGTKVQSAWSHQYSAFAFT